MPMRMRRSDLTAVLALVNRGRTALGMDPLEELPKGIVDDPHECPLGRAFRAGIGENGCTCCYPEVTAHFDLRHHALALKAAYETQVERGSFFWMVRLPGTLARFNREFNAGAFPNLIDRDCLTVEEVARRMKCRVETVQYLISQRLVPAITTSLCHVYVRWSALKTRRVREAIQAADTA
jgi:hypothetical protein